MRFSSRRRGSFPLAPKWKRVGYWLRLPRWFFLAKIRKSCYVDFVAIEAPPRRPKVARARKKGAGKVFWSWGSGQPFDKAHFGEGNPRKSKLFPWKNLAGAWGPLCQALLDLESVWSADRNTLRISATLRLPGHRGTAPVPSRGEVASAFASVRMSAQASRF